MKARLLLFLYLITLVAAPVHSAHAAMEGYSSAVVLEESSPHTGDHGLGVHHGATQCCMIAIGHCVSGLLRDEGLVGLVRYWDRANAAIVDEDSTAKADPGVDLPPPRI